MEELIKKQLLWNRIIAGLLIIILLIMICSFIFAVRYFTGLNSIIQNLDNISISLSDAAEQLSDVDWETVGQNLETISASLSQVNWVELTDNISDMSLKAQESLQVAQDAVDELDIDTLNKAISDLKAVIEPLANLINKFRN